MSDNRLNRPVYILGHNADTAGCGHHRIIRPIEMLARLGMAMGRCDLRVWPDELLHAMAPDVVIWQRQHEDHQLEHMARYRAALPNAFMVYEVDDALSAVPHASWHRSFMPDDINARMAKAVTFCDVITASTRALARHMREVCGPFDKSSGGVDIRVVPNMLGQDDFQQAQSVRLANRKLHRKPRIGWGGGISHSGDLAMIAEAVDETSDRVQWVFLGMQPEGIKASVEFHMGVQPREYLAKLASLDLDLMVAPLEDNLFNRCKSNLRLIEAGACGYPVIASPVEPYTDGSPPLYAYADGVDPASATAAWVRAIDDFLALNTSEQQTYGNKLKAWAERNYLLDEKGEERARMWLRSSQKPFRPRRNTSPSGVTAICPQPSERMTKAFDGHYYTSLATACETTGDVLYVAPNTVVTAGMVERLRAHLSQNPNTCSVSALSNDGGVCGFPKQWQYGPFDETHGLELDKLAAATFDDTSIEIAFPSGPLTLLSRRAIDSFGAPEPCEPGQEEVALIEWGILMVTRGLRARCAPNVFATVTQPPAAKNLQLAVTRTQMRYPPVQLPPDPLTDVRCRLELAFHRERFKTPLPSQQPAYADWAAYFDTPGNRDLIEMRLKADSIAVGLSKPTFAIVSWKDCRTEPQTWPHYAHIAASKFSDAIALAEQGECDWIIFARPGSVIRPHALYMLAEKIGEAPDARLIYSDHDYLDKQGNRCDHDFKPEFDLEMLLARDYVTPFCAFRVDALKAMMQDFEIGPEYVIGEATVYEMALLTAMLTLFVGRSIVAHVPRILCHLPKQEHFREASATAVKARKAAAVAKRFGWSLRIEPHQRAGTQTAGVWYGPVTDQPLVSIIVPTKNRLDMLKPCIESLLHITRYQHFEILIVDNGSDNPEHKAYLNEVSVRENPRVQVLSWPELYNWSALNNWAAGRAHGEYLLFLNDDTRIVDKDWLDEMVGCAMRPHVGAVGARLLYPHGAVQHVGVISNKGLTGHIHKGIGDGVPGYNGIAMICHESTAVTGACLLIRKQLFVDADGFDNRLAHNFNDVDLCLRLRKMGFVNIVAAGAQLHHLEGATRTSGATQEGNDLILAEGRILQSLHPEPEPYWNPNLVIAHHEGGTLVSGMNFDIFSWPAPKWPWRGDDWRGERVLVVGDDGTVHRAEAQEGNAVYLTAIDGFRMQIFNPPLENLPPWDIRAPKDAKAIFERLGIDRIVVRSIIGAPVQLLAFLLQLDIPIDYRPFVAEAACPRLGFTTDGNKDCGKGWRDGMCQQCIDMNGSPFGQVSIAGWHHQWRRFIKAAETDFSNLNETARTATDELYVDRAAADRAAAL